MASLVLMRPSAAKMASRILRGLRPQMASRFKCGLRPQNGIPVLKRPYGRCRRPGKKIM